MEKPLPILLRYPEHPNLRLLNLLQNGYKTMSTSTNSVDVDGFILKLEDEAKPIILEKAILLTYGAYNVHLYYQDEVDAYEAEKKARNERYFKELKEEQEKAKIQRYNDAVDFWAQYDIPFAFTVEIKEVLSGLKEGSNGSGYNRRTRYHIFLKEAYEKGRFVRPKNEFLCSSVKSKYHGDWSGTLGDGILYRFDEKVGYPITCRSCLEQLEKFKKRIQ